MNRFKFVTLIVVSVVIAVLLATALASFTRVFDTALAEISPAGAGGGDSGSANRPSTASKNYLPIIFLNSATAGGAWLLGGNAGTNALTDFLGTTDNMTLTLRVSNTVAYRIVPAADPAFGFSPNLIGGSPENWVSPGLYGATIAGGGAGTRANVITGIGNYATIGGGVRNTASGGYASVGGGDLNTASGNVSFVGGGYHNTASGIYATVGGGWNHTASGQNATIAGGGDNIAWGIFSTIGGGNANTANGNYSTVGGGNSHIVNGYYATVGGGSFNTASNNYATVGGGELNIASGTDATVGGGANNTASNLHATVGGGFGNTASGSHATVPGGYNNVAFGAYSLAAGHDAQAFNQGAFVWADSTNATFSSTGNDQFLVRASGGITLYTNSAATVGVQAAPGSGSWSTVSNKNLKANFADVDSRAILERVRELPITTWNYKTQDKAIRHIGPMAQDFAAAFNVGENDTTISTVDAQGVALAAIKGLNQVVAEKETRLAALEKDNAELKTRLVALEQNAPSNVLTLNALAPWAVVGLVAVWAMRKKR